MVSGPSTDHDWIVFFTVAAILTVLGILPALIIGIGPVAVSTAGLAVLFLMARRYEVI